METNPRFALRSSLFLELLESRVAPAVLVAAGGHSATYIDVDGDKVTVKVSTGTLTAGLFTTSVTGAGEQLQTIDFSGGGFDNANLTVGVVKALGGDGLANVGRINSTGHDLGKVNVKGDLGQIDAGSNALIPAVKSLAVRSMGRLGTDTQAAGGDLQSDITGALGALTVTGDVKEALVNVMGPNGQVGTVTIGGSLIGGSTTNRGRIASQGDMGVVKIGHDVLGGAGGFTGLISSGGGLAGVSIGGSLIGGSDESSGAIFSRFDMGPVNIGHDVQGGAGPRSGYIQSTGKLASLNIGGSLIGAANTLSGAIYCSGDVGPVNVGHDVQGGLGIQSGLIGTGKLASLNIGGSLIGGSNESSGEVFSFGDMGPVKIGHDMQGGSASDSGRIRSLGKLAGVSIGGSLIGGRNSDSGEIFSSGDIGKIKIGHDFTGGSINGADVLDKSGVIKSFGRIASVTIGGSIISGTDNSSGDLTDNATIRAGNDIGSLEVKGSLVGNFTSDGFSPVVISARGQAKQGTSTDLAIGKVRIGGRAEFTNVLAGYDTNLTAVNGDAQIGSVSVGGDWVASNLVAGAMNTASGNASFGDANDASIGPGSGGIVATIANITIKGQVFGTPDAFSNADHYGFATQQVGRLKVGGNSITLAAGPHNDNHGVGETFDLTVHEV